MDRPPIEETDTIEAPKRRTRAQKAGQRTATLDGQKAAFDVPEGMVELLPFWFGPEGQEMRAVAVLEDGTRVTLKAMKGG